MKYSNLLEENPINNAANVMKQGMKKQSGQGMVVQSYCQSIITQPFINLGDFAKLKEIEKKINNGLETARGHANYYIGTLQPELITNISNIDNYYNLYNSVPIILPSDASEEQWLNLLRELKTQTENYAHTAKETADKIGVFYAQLGEDSSTFQENLNTLNSIVGGNEGVLQDLEDQLDEINGEITGVIAGIVVSGLAVVGGIFLVAVGTIGSFVTAGTSAPIALAGGALIVAGVAGAAGLGIALANLLDAKSETLRKKITLEGEVKAIAGMSTSYKNLYTQATEAHKAANEMKNAWDFLSSDLSTLSEDLKNGTLSTGQLRSLWLSAADNAVETVKNDIGIIKGQMTGVTTATAPNNENLAEFVRNQARSKSSVEFPDSFAYWRLN